MVGLAWGSGTTAESSKGRFFGLRDCDGLLRYDTKGSKLRRNGYRIRKREERMQALDFSARQLNE